MANIKTRYDKEDDALMLFFGKGKVDDAQQTGNVIAHFSKSGKLLLLEILEASKFLKDAYSAFPSKIRRQVLTS